MILEQAKVNTTSLQNELNDIARRLKLDVANDALFFPRFVLVETVRICNSRCPFCAIGQWDKSVPFMSEELFQKVAAELIQYKDWIFCVYLQKAGEPLLDLKIAARIKQLKDGGIRRVTLSTNASLLTEEKARELMRAGLDEIMLSIDSVTKEKYEEMRRGLDYDTVLGNIKALFRIRDEVKPEMLVRVRGIAFCEWDKPEGQKEVEAWERFWQPLKKKHDRIYMKKPHTWGNQKRWEGHTPTKYDMVYHPCILPWSTMNINTDGKVGMCGQDYDATIMLGDVNRQTMKEIWTSEAWNRIRSLHSSGNRNEMSFCRGCQIFDPDFTLEKDRPEWPV